jgi:hypothetical protein
MSLYKKQMGAYYTTNDISEYITKNAIIPFLFRAVEKRYPAAFEPHAPIWRLLRENPDRYIYPAIRSENYLPAETKQDHIVRQKRYAEIEAMLVAGEIVTIHDFITYNLDIGRFAQDVIEHCQESDLLEAFYESLQQMKILDPTCGSGAFLLAALNVLEPLYKSCLDQMSSQTIPAGELAGDPRLIVGDTYCRYFILKSIIDNNLYGVDIMEEAVKICKSQLYLELISEIEDREDDVATLSGRDQAVPPYTIGLPDIDSLLNSNIRAGNALVGFITHQGQPSTRTQLDQALAIQYDIDPQDAPAFEQWCSRLRPFHWCIEFDNIMQRGGFDVIIGNPPYAEYNRMKDVYTLPPGMYKTESCGNLYAFCIERFIALGNASSTSGLIVPLSIVCTNRMEPVRRILYKTFSHVWFNNYDTIPSTLFSGTVQRNTIILASRGVINKFNDQNGSCHPVGAGEDAVLGGDPCGRPREASGDPARETLRGVYPRAQRRAQGDLTFPTLPVKILHHVPTNQPTSNVYTTRNQKWYASERPSLFESVSYLHIGSLSSHDIVPKVSTAIELNILNKIHVHQFPITSYIQQHSHNTLVYKRRWSYFLLFADTIEGIVLPDGSIRQQQDVKILALQPHLDRFVFIALLSSSLFYFHYSVFSDFRHVNKADFDRFMFDYRKLSATATSQLSALGQILMQSYSDSLEWRTCNYVGSIGQCQVPFYRQGASKSILDAIDTVLAEHYGMTGEELDFILSYDSKFRMGENHAI